MAMPGNEVSGDGIRTDGAVQAGDAEDVGGTALSLAVEARRAGRVAAVAAATAAGAAATGAASGGGGGAGGRVADRGAAAAGARVAATGTRHATAGAGAAAASTRAGCRRGDRRGGSTLPRFAARRRQGQHGAGKEKGKNGGDLHVDKDWSLMVKLS
jgi:hypothetical protein